MPKEKSAGNLECVDQLPKELKLHSPHVRHSTHTKLHFPNSHLLPSNRYRRYMILIIFNSVIPSHVTASKILISPEVRFLMVWYSLNHFPVTTACGHQFHAQIFYPHHTFTILRVGSALRIWSEISGGSLLRKQSASLGRWLFSQRSSVIHVWQLCLRRFPPLGLHKRIFNLCLLILLIHTNHKCNKM